MEIAKYILSIFKHYTAIIFSWGAHNYTAIEANEEGEGGLLFNVAGFKFQGKVKVMLNWLDTFTITFYNKDNSIKEVVDDVYVDSLIDVLDYYIERVDNYEERVNGEYGRARAC